ncbi:MAG: GIY-YIG nuclease family protein [Steroidobacterales bacterium]
MSSSTSRTTVTRAIRTPRRRRTESADAPGVIAPAPAGGLGWWVYLVRAANGSLYTGITTDLSRRLAEHRNSKRGARFFRSSRAVKLVYSERAADRSSASKREAAIKRLPRVLKLALVKTRNRPAPATSRRFRRP